jgi:thiol-disulfide isomerase/thioredoxin
MAVLCICGVCVPYTVLWPVVLLLLKPIIDYFQCLFGFAKKVENVENYKCKVKDGNNCCEIKVPEGRSGTFSLNSDDDFSSITNGRRITFVRFTAEWCKPCKEIEPAFMTLGAENPDSNFITIDVDQFDEIAAKHSAVTIPLFLAISGGSVLGRISGKDEVALKKFVTDTIDFISHVDGYH